MAFVNDDTAGHTVLVGNDRLSVDDYANRIEQDVNLQRLTQPEAQQALADGKVSALEGAETFPDVGGAVLGTRSTTLPGLLTA